MSPMQSMVALLGGHRKPWLARKAWRERRVVSHGVRGCFFALAIPFFGLLALMSFMGALINVFENPGEAAQALLVGAIFGGALAGVTYWWLKWRKFGKLVCHLETLPGVIGGWFKASVEVKLPAHALPAVKVKLENFKTVGRSRVTKWKTSELVSPDRFTRIQGDRYMVPVRFQIPAREDYYKNWLLQLKAELPGVNLRADFLVPIFKTIEASFEEQAAYSTGNRENVEKTSGPEQFTFFNGQPQPEEDFGKLQDYTQLNDPLYGGSTTEVTEEEFSSLIGKNAESYIQKFRKFNVNGVDKFSWTWHWPAFFFGFLWMLYRKLYFWALVAFAINIGIIPLIPSVFGLLMTIVWGITGRYIYYKHAKKKIIRYKTANAPVDSSQAAIALSKIGGVNNWAPVLAVFTILAISSLPLWTFLYDDEAMHYNAAAKSELHNAAISQEVYKLEHGTYADSTEKLLGDKYGLYLSESVVVEVLRADTESYLMWVHHERGNRRYLLAGPDGEIEEMDRSD